MTPAEFRVVRHALGLSQPWLARHLGVSERTVRSWEKGQHPIPDGVEATMTALEERAAEQVGALVEAYRDRLDPAEVPVVVPDHPSEDGAPVMWWLMVAWRAACEVPGLEIRHEAPAGAGAAERDALTAYLPTKEKP